MYSVIVMLSRENAVTVYEIPGFSGYTDAADAARNIQADKPYGTSCTAVVVNKGSR